jgi:catechol 2,3-dioxygenase-like lactoylglutathione lyase family enzyme
MTLHHVALETHPADVEAELAFWALLGFAHVPEPPGLTGRAVWTERGATQVHLLLTDEPTVMHSGHAAVVADDYEATLDRLRAAGFELRPGAELWGSPRAFVTTPGGHRVEVMQRPPAPLSR